jgi:hypothetical protein
MKISDLGAALPLGPEPKRRLQALLGADPQELQLLHSSPVAWIVTMGWVSAVRSLAKARLMERALLSTAFLGSPVQTPTLCYRQRPVGA